MRGSPKSGWRKRPPPFTDKHRAHLSASRIGHIVSTETRAKISSTQKGRPVLPEMRARISATLMGRPGRKASAETLAKMSAAHKGRHVSEATKEKLRAANLGKKRSAEAITKTVAKLIGRRRCPFTREELSRRAVENAKAWAVAHPERARMLGRQSRATRRARQMAMFVEHIDPSTVFDRDAGVCGICHEAVERNQQWEVDHIVPLSKGGAHSYANVQLAHIRCNRRKGAKVVELIGVNDLVRSA